MNLSIVLSTDQASGIDEVQSWLDFNNIPYQQQVFWNPSLMNFYFGPEIKNSIIVVNHNILQKILWQDNGIDAMRNLLESNNHAWVVGMDLALALADPKIQPLIKALDQAIPSDRLTLFLDAQPLTDFYTNDLSCIKISVLRYNFFMRSLPRIQADRVIKDATKFDYLLTMIRKPGRPHRDLLWQHLQNNQNFRDHGLISSKTSRDDNWLGRVNIHNHWYDGHASMDLYLQCKFEIVPETCHDNLHFFTEKTYKPIMTQTPFVIISTPGYLMYLRSLGFQTFSDIFDESYDVEPNLEKRVAMAVNTLEEIINNNSFSVYEATKEILTYNFQKLCEISGKWNHEFDKIMWYSLDMAQKISG